MKDEKQVDELKIVQGLGEKKFVTIKGRKFYSPPKISLEQWYNIIDVIDTAEIDLSKEVVINKATNELQVKIMGIVKKLAKGRLVGKLLAIILIPEEEEEWEEKFIENADLMNKIDDTSLVEVLVHFFGGRGDLITTLADFITDYVIEKLTSRLTSNLSKIHSGQKEQVN